jgi:RimJ/RimL family protein N-acetyltransferase
MPEPRVQLTPLRDEDSDRLFAWINDRELVVSSAPFKPVARADHDAWFAQIRAREEDVRIFAIRVADRLIGSCQLHSIDPVADTAELQIRIGERHEQGRGYGRQAVETLLKIAFHEMCLKSVTLHVFESNGAARAVYRKTGFVEVPHDETVEIDGRTERVLRMVRPHVVAIHQPNFFPWLGYFDKLRRADTFVLLDTVEFSKGSRTNRVEVLVGGEPRWITAPVQRGGIGGRILEVYFDRQRDWRDKIVKTLQQNYTGVETVEDLVRYDEPRLAPYNEHAIRRLADALGIDARIERASDLAVEGRATELLIAIVREVGGAAYLAGGGAGGYQEDEQFAAADIELIPQDFDAPHGLSVLHELLGPR